jgi:hypothetical protein
MSLCIVTMQAVPTGQALHQAVCQIFMTAYDRQALLRSSAGHEVGMVQL